MHISLAISLSIYILGTYIQGQLWKPFTAESKQHIFSVQFYALVLHNLYSEEIGATSTKQMTEKTYLYGVKDGWGR